MRFSQVPTWSPWPAGGWPTKTCSTCASSPRPRAARPSFTAAWPAATWWRKYGLGQGTQPPGRGQGIRHPGGGLRPGRRSPDLVAARQAGCRARGAVLIVVNPRPTKLDQVAAHRLRYAYGEEAAIVSALTARIESRAPGLGCGRASSRGRSPGRRGKPARRVRQRGHRAWLPASRWPRPAPRSWPQPGILGGPITG